MRLMECMWTNVGLAVEVLFRSQMTEFVIVFNCAGLSDGSKVTSEMYQKCSMQVIDE